MEDKKEFVRLLGEALKLSREGIKSVEYIKSDFTEAVIIRYENGYINSIDVTGDCCAAILFDITRNFWKRVMS